MLGGRVDDEVIGNNLMAVIPEEISLYASDFSFGV